LLDTDACLGVLAPFRPLFGPGCFGVTVGHELNKIDWALQIFFGRSLGDVFKRTCIRTDLNLRVALDGILQSLVAYVGTLNPRIGIIPGYQKSRAEFAEIVEKGGEFDRIHAVSDQCKIGEIRQAALHNVGVGLSDSEIPQALLRGAGSGLEK